MKLSSICAVVLSSVLTSQAADLPSRALRTLQHPLSDLHIHKSERRTDLIKLHKDLIEIESTSGSEAEAAHWLQHSLKTQGYHTELQRVTHSRHNVLAWPGDKRNARLLITSHIDTVPPYIPYKISKNGSDTVISGRGSVDAKGAVAAMIVAANTLLDDVEITPNDFAFLFVVGEETHGDGMRAANSLGLTPKSIIFGEPTEGKLASGHKGIVLFEIKVHGKAAHSGYPQLGVSANVVMVKILSALVDLEQHLPSSDSYGLCTLNVGIVNGGVAANVVAAEASAKVSIRLAAGDPEEIKQLVIETVEKAAKGYKADNPFSVDMEFLGRGYGVVPLATDVPGFDTIVVAYGTDVPNFNITVEGQKRYLYGPGSILVAHSDHEALTLTDLETAVQDYKKLILHSLQI